MEETTHFLLWGLCGYVLTFLPSIQRHALHKQRELLRVFLPPLGDLTDPLDAGVLHRARHTQPSL